MLVADFAEENFIFDHLEQEAFLLAGFYLVQQLAVPTISFTIDKQEYQCVYDFQQRLVVEGIWSDVFDLLMDEKLSLRERIQLAKDWIGASGVDDVKQRMVSVAFLLTSNDMWKITDQNSVVCLDGLVDTHPRIQQGSLSLSWTGLLES